MIDAVRQKGIKENKVFFFEKKEAKNFHSFAHGTELERVNQIPTKTDISFLIRAVAVCDPLFSKKNSLYSDTRPGIMRAASSPSIAVPA
jgi:hypothetical protein